MLQEEMQTIRFLHETRHVQKLDVLMDQSSPTDTPDDGDRQFLAKVRKELARWKEIEEIHGPGACLKLDHPAVQHVKLISPYVRFLDSCYPIPDFCSDGSKPTSTNCSGSNS